MAISSKNKDEIAKAAKDFETKGDQKKMLPEDREMLERIKKALESSQTQEGSHFIPNIVGYFLLQIYF